DVHRLDIVRLRNETYCESPGRQGCAHEIGAQLEQSSRAQRQYLALFVKGELAVVDRLATAVIGEHAFRARGNPVDRTSDTARSPQHQRVVGKRSALESKSAADVGRDDAHLVLRSMKDVRHLLAY